MCYNLMLSGYYARKNAKYFSKLKPIRILEIGTYTGYSALCLAEGLADNGELYTVKNKELEDIAHKYFDLSVI